MHQHSLAAETLFEQSGIMLWFLQNASTVLDDHVLAGYGLGNFERSCKHAVSGRTPFEHAIKRGVKFLSSTGHRPTSTDAPLQRWRALNYRLINFCSWRLSVSLQPLTACFVAVCRAGGANSSLEHPTAFMLLLLQAAGLPCPKSEGICLINIL